MHGAEALKWLVHSACGSAVPCGLLHHQSTKSSISSAFRQQEQRDSSGRWQNSWD